MRMKVKTICSVLLIMVCAVLLIAGCKGNSKQSENGNHVEKQQENDNASKNTESKEEASDNIISKDDTTQNNTSDTSDTTVPEDDTKKEESDNQEANKSTKELSIYTINDETLETEPVIANIPSDTKVTPQVVVDQVINAFADNSYVVDVQNVSTEGDAIIVNFSKDSAPVINVGASVECTTLDCISYSLLDNIPECKKIIFRIDGEAYSTGHIEKGINEPYATGN